MSKIIDFVRAHRLKLVSVVIALVLWLQVHGQGVGTLSMDVPLQVGGLPPDMAIVNDLPDHVRISVYGLQARLKELNPKDIFVPLDASGLKEPGVVERALKVSDIRLPVGLTIEKMQPDKLKLQIDRVVSRSISVRPRFELPEGWKAVDIVVEPAEVELSGPEVWLETLAAVETTAVKPEIKAGPFELQVGVVSPTGKAIRMVKPDIRLTVRGVLMHVANKSKGK